MESWTFSQAVSGLGKVEVKKGPGQANKIRPVQCFNNHVCFGSRDGIPVRKDSCGFGDVQVIFARKLELSLDTHHMGTNDCMVRGNILC